jgi:DNA-binding MarR family transcriptional regulator
MDAEVTRLPIAQSDPAAPVASAASVPAAPRDVAALASALGQVDAAHRRLRTRMAHRLGITVTDLTALIVISDPRESTPKQLANELGLTTGAVTAVIDRLVTAGQVRRSPKAGDRRSILLELTTEGAGTVEIVSGLYLGAITTALEASPHVFNRHILDSLRHTADALDGAAGAPVAGGHEAPEQLRA